MTIDFLSGDFEVEETTSIEAKDLATLIAQAPGQMEEVVLSGVSILGDFSVVAAALNSPNMRNLKSFSMLSFPLPEDALMLVGEAMSHLPELEIFEYINFAQNQGQPIWQVLDPIVKNATSPVKRITVVGSRLPREVDTAGKAELCSFFCACGKMVNLKSLEFGTEQNLPKSAIESVATMIRESTSLAVVRVKIGRSVRLGGIAAALKENKSLEKLSISTLRDSFHRPAAIINVLSAFHAVLAHDCFTLTALNIESLNLGVSETGVNRGVIRGNAVPDLATLGHTESINFFVKLNMMGRRRLLGSGQDHNTSTEEWMDVISDEDDVSVIFYFLGKNPSLCLPENGNSNDKAVAQETLSDIFSDYYSHLDSDNDSVARKKDGPFASILQDAAALTELCESKDCQPKGWEKIWEKHLAAFQEEFLALSAPALSTEESNP